MNKRIYMDHAASAPMSRAAIEYMAEISGEFYGNPSSIHSPGVAAKKLLNESREKIAALLGCRADEIFFTSGGTESVTWAIRAGAVISPKSRHIISTAIEHHALQSVLENLAREGFKIDFLPANENGIVRAADLEKMIHAGVELVSCMFLNNEIGTIQPVGEIAEIAHRSGALAFTDAVQAVGHMPVDLSKIGADMLAFSGHKFGSPKGIGGLFVRRGLKIPALIPGGGQESSRRGGTENVVGAAVMAFALEESLAKLSERKRILAMRERIINTVLEKIFFLQYNLLLLVSMKIKSKTKPNGRQP